MKSIFTLIISLFALNILAAELDGIKFDDKVKIGNKELILNGIGIRKATIFKVKVYYGGLYLEQKSTDHNVVLNSQTNKQIVMNFVHDVDAKKLKSGFSEGFENANPNTSAQLKAALDKFNSTIVDVVKGDKFIINFETDGVVINVKGKTFEKIGNAEFSKALLAIWFINPTDEGLKKGLLAQ
jgi:hypothetical protein